MYNFKREENIINEFKTLVNGFINGECPNMKFRDGNTEEDIVELAIRKICPTCPLNKKVSLWIEVEGGDEEQYVSLCSLLQAEFDTDEQEDDEEYLDEDDISLMNLCAGEKLFD